MNNKDFVNTLASQSGLSLKETKSLIEEFIQEFADKETLEAFNAFAKLLKLHKVWIGDWQPDWKTYKDEKYIIATKRGEIDLRSTWVNSSPMCFPTKGMRKLFYLYFRELLEKAKPLL